LSTSNTSMYVCTYYVLCTEIDVIITLNGESEEVVASCSLNIILVIHDDKTEFEI
jgi:hypothetical protein